MATKIRLKRLGKIRAPYYRVVVADSRTKRDGRVIEEIGKYHPTEEPSFIEIASERAQYWLGVGAQPTPQVLVASARRTHYRNVFAGRNFQVDVQQQDHGANYSLNASDAAKTKILCYVNLGGVRG